MNEIQVFNYASRQVRTVEKNGEAWFVAKDVCEVLNLHTSQIRRIDKDEKGLYKIQTPGGIPA